jgi:NADPH:quinone reductase-like Zn-dependent oxidoreductase
MKQWVSKQDGIENMQLVEAPMPDEATLKEGEVLVKINRVSLNYRDTEGMSHAHWGLLKVGSGS